MSRIGKNPIILKKNINVKINKKQIIIEGPKGSLSYILSPEINIEQTETELKLYKINESKTARQLYGLSRTLINNMVIGVSQGFNKKLKIQGVGYRAQIDKKNLILNVGYSHPVCIESQPDINIKVDNQTSIEVSGINKEIVGQVAAKIRSIRPPEPYKGKGIRYENEIVRKKVGKAGK
uniref:Ribosomal protein L6 n=1 Tax=Synarthrophyton chejuense TaxID=2485825 RepID=A0A3G3MFX0_9FLOR|nr:ribosomal protein L6 [Synarthrophyton chejuense]AYR05720.1 ribosomal protein L6 [Synarthrophyton chejuense]